MNRHIEEEYQVISVLNQKNAYRLYVAEHRTEHTRWAVKELPKDAGDGDALSRALRIKEMQDPLLPVIREVYEDEELLSTVEEYIPGVSLRSYVEQSGAMEESDVFSWMSDLAGFLHRLHTGENGMILGDLDPGDLRLMPDNSVRIEDYSALCGLRQEPEEETPYGFHAPEQRFGGPIGPWTDLYALGAVAFYALTGKDPDEPPYRFYPLRHYNPSCSAGMEYILNKCLQQDPALRYRSAAELLYDLQHISRFNKVLGRYKRRKFFRGAAVVVLVLGGLALMAYGFLTGWRERRDQYSALLSSASTLTEKGSYQEAFAQLTEAQGLYEDDVRAYEAWAEALFRSGQYVQCADYCMQQLARFPDSVSLVLKLAMSDYAMEQYRAAADYFRLAGEKNMDTEQLFCYVLSLIRLERLDEAANLFQSNADRWDYGTSYYIQGELYYAMGDLAGAQAALSGALGESKDERLYLQSARLQAKVYLQAAEEGEDVIADPLERCLSLLENAISDPRYASDPELKTLYARALLAQSDGKENAEKAAVLLRELIDAGARDEEHYLLLAEALSGSGDHQGALDAALAAEERFPESWRVLTRVSWEEIAAEEEKPSSQRDYSAAVADHARAEELLGDEEPDGLMDALREKIQALRDAGRIKD